MNEEILRLIRSGGFENIELWGMAPHLSLNDPAKLKDISRVIKDQGIRVRSMHAPFYRAIWDAFNDNWLSLSDPDAGRRREALDMAVKAIKASEIFGHRVLVLHCGFSEKKNGRDEKYLVGSIKKLIEISRDYGVKLALENGPDSYGGVSSALGIIQEFDPESLGFCLDLGHANLEPGMNPARAIKRIGLRLANLHVSDNYGKTDEHNPPGQGNIAWKKVGKNLGALSHPEVSTGSAPQLTFTFELADHDRGQPQTLERFDPVVKKARAFFNKFFPG
ncbi:MAG: sugar phosphate isomerase/epimerase [Proteobacteria bacterium]|nr:sugar phosphate isomerase/epimerase [Pseudomonadota bacterium]